MAEKDKAAPAAPAFKDSYASLDEVLKAHAPFWGGHGDKFIDTSDDAPNGALDDAAIGAKPVDIPAAASSKK